MYYFCIENVDGEDDTLFKTEAFHIMVKILKEYEGHHIIMTNEPLDYDGNDYELVTDET